MGKDFRPIDALVNQVLSKCDFLSVNTSIAHNEMLIIQYYLSSPADDIE